VYSHAPAGYECPLCQLVRGEDNPDPWTKQSDVVFRDDDVIVCLNARWWGEIEGNALVIPTTHIENIYDVTQELGGKVHEAARRVASAFMETYPRCRGTSTRQHNGPAGNQDVWHYHMHVFPRRDRGDLYGAPARMSTLAERAPYAERLRTWFASR
jgi:histidine triad (HIT) family protein